VWWERAIARGLSALSIFFLCWIPSGSLSWAAHLPSGRQSPEQASSERGHPEALAAIQTASQWLWAATGVQVPPTEIVFDSEPGCNAAWDGSRLLLLAGNTDCRPAAEVPDLVLHEYGHRVTQFLLNGQTPDHSVGEALADLFAVIFSTDSKIAEGFYHQRSWSWLRDLSERRRYPEQARGIYSESQILASALYPVIRSVSTHEALQFWVTLHEKLPSTPGRGLLRAAQAAYDAALQVLEPWAACLTYRSLAQNGLSPRTGRRSVCDATLGVIPLRVTRNDPAYRLSSPALPGQATRVRFVVLHSGRESASSWGTELNFSWSGNARCGDRIDFKVQAVDARGILIAEGQHTLWHGQVGQVETARLNLEQTSTPIPDGRGELRFSFNAPLSPSTAAVEASLLLSVDHPYADDLFLSGSGPGLALQDLVRGHEEVQFPERVNLPITPSQGELRLDFSLRDIARGTAGLLRAAALEWKTVRLACAP
jgi:hypothetical protein